MNDFEGSRSEFLRILAEFGEEPAFVQRARGVQQAWQHLLSECRAEREELLTWPRMHMAKLAAKINNDWSRLRRYLRDDRQVAQLQSLRDTLAPHGTSDGHWLTSERQALTTFLESARRFNGAWQNSLARLDLEPINHQRRDYNEYYPIEKACAFGREHATRGFTPLAMVDRDRLLQEFPLLVIPELA